MRGRSIESWREDYNRVRPHSALGNLTPEEYVGEHPVDETDLATFTPEVRQ